MDIGCGEGHNTRLLARRGARVTAIDIADDFIAHARQAETHEPLGIDYRVASAVNLPFTDATFDFARWTPDAFEGYVVKKDLALRFKGQYPVPTYVGEFLLGRYCATTDEAEIEEGELVEERGRGEHLGVQERRGDLPEEDRDAPIADADARERGGDQERDAQHNPEEFARVEFA